MEKKLTREEAHFCLMAIEIASMAYSTDFEEKIKEMYSTLDLSNLLEKLKEMKENSDA